MIIRRCEGETTKGDLCKARIFGTDLFCRHHKSKQFEQFYAVFPKYLVMEDQSFESVFGKKANDDN